MCHCTRGSHERLNLYQENYTQLVYATVIFTLIMTVFIGLLLFIILPAVRSGRAESNEVDYINEEWLPNPFNSTVVDVEPIGEFVDLDETSTMMTEEEINARKREIPSLIQWNLFYFEGNQGLTVKNTNKITDKNVVESKSVVKTGTFVPQVKYEEQTEQGEPTTTVEPIISTTTTSQTVTNDDIKEDTTMSQDCTECHSDYTTFSYVDMTSTTTVDPISTTIDPSSIYGNGTEVTKHEKMTTEAQIVTTEVTPNVESVPTEDDLIAIDSNGMLHELNYDKNHTGHDLNGSTPVPNERNWNRQPSIVTGKSEKVIQNHDKEAILPEKIIIRATAQTSPSTVSSTIENSTTKVSITKGSDSTTDGSTTDGSTTEGSTTNGSTTEGSTTEGSTSRRTTITRFRSPFSPNRGSYRHRSRVKKLPHERPKTSTMSTTANMMSTPSSTRTTSARGRASSYYSKTMSKVLTDKSPHWNLWKAKRLRGSSRSRLEIIESMSTSTSTSAKIPSTTMTTKKVTVPKRMMKRIEVTTPSTTLMDEPTTATPTEIELVTASTTKKEKLTTTTAKTIELTTSSTTKKDKPKRLTTKATNAPKVTTVINNDNIEELSTTSASMDTSTINLDSSTESSPTEVQYIREMKVWKPYKPARKGRGWFRKVKKARTTQIPITIQTQTTTQVPTTTQPIVMEETTPEFIMNWPITSEPIISVSSRKPRRRQNRRNKPRAKKRRTTTYSPGFFENPSTPKVIPALYFQTIVMGELKDILLPEIHLQDDQSKQNQKIANHSSVQSSTDLPTVTSTSTSTTSNNPSRTRTATTTTITGSIEPTDINITMVDSMMALTDMYLPDPEFDFLRIPTRASKNRPNHHSSANASQMIESLTIPPNLMTSMKILNHASVYKCRTYQSTNTWGHHCSLHDLKPDHNITIQLEPSIPCTNITEIDLGGWSGSSIPTLTRTFCDAFPNILFFYGTHLGVQTIEETTFNNCTNLRRLHLSDNLLTELPLNVFEQNKELRWISLGSNKFVSIDPAIFMTNKNLIAIELENNLLRKFSLKKFGTLTTLRQLDLRDNHLTDLNETVLFKKFPKIQSLFLCGNDKIDKERQKTIQSCFELRNLECDLIINC